MAENLCQGGREHELRPQTLNTHAPCPIIFHFQKTNSKMQLLTSNAAPYPEHRTDVSAEAPCIGHKHRKPGLCGDDKFLFKFLTFVHKHKRS